MTCDVCKGPSDDAIDVSLVASTERTVSAGPWRQLAWRRERTVLKARESTRFRFNVCGDCFRRWTGLAREDWRSGLVKRLVVLAVEIATLALLLWVPGGIIQRVREDRARMAEVSRCEQFLQDNQSLLASELVRAGYRGQYIGGTSYPSFEPLLEMELVLPDSANKMLELIPKGHPMRSRLLEAVGTVARLKEIWSNAERRKWYLPSRDDDPGRRGIKLAWLALLAGSAGLFQVFLVWSSLEERPSLKIGQQDAKQLLRVFRNDVVDKACRVNSQLRTGTLVIDSVTVRD
ncbi:MAG: hypothetical protein ABSD27_03920 [Bryobacteraceae bacterium]|jgi:hypothetical protein